MGFDGPTASEMFDDASTVLIIAWVFAIVSLLATVAMYYNRYKNMLQLSEELLPPPRGTKKRVQHYYETIVRTPLVYSMLYLHTRDTAVTQYNLLATDTILYTYLFFNLKLTCYKYFWNI